MGKQNSKFLNELHKLSSTERVERAKVVTSALTSRILEVIELACSCEYFVYRETLTKQIPDSFAGHAFLAVQNALFKQLIVRTVALWDTPDFNVISIPVVIELIDDPAVIHDLQQEHYSAHAKQGFRNLNPSNDPDIERAVQSHFRNSQRDFAASQAQNVDHHLAVCIEAVRDIEREHIIVPIRNLRDHVSHSLVKTRRESMNHVLNMKYGEERSLREKSIAIIQDLYCWVNGTSFDIAGDCVDNSKRNAKDLWERCTFNFD